MRVASAAFMIAENQLLISATYFDENTAFGGTVYTIVRIRVNSQFQSNVTRQR